MEDINLDKEKVFKKILGIVYIFHNSGDLDIIYFVFKVVVDF